mgnify:CR=1 FL=1
MDDQVLSNADKRLQLPSTNGYLQKPQLLALEQHQRVHNAINDVKKNTCIREITQQFDQREGGHELRIFIERLLAVGSLNEQL